MASPMSEFIDHWSDSGVSGLIMEMVCGIESATNAPTRIFLSWTHRDRKLKEALLTDLLPAFVILQDISIEWWEDSSDLW